MPIHAIKSAFKAKYAWAVLLGLLVGLRLLALAVSPLPPGGDEAQYWHWSTTLDWGYFSKPPLIAWLISLTSWSIGDSAFGLRFSAPILHGIGAVFLFLTARQLWPQERMVATWTAAIYLLMPAISLSSFLLTTDALLLPLAAMALYGFFRMLDQPGSLVWPVWLGVALGLGLLAKYAVLFLGAGFALLILVDPALRQAIGWRKNSLILLIPILMILPNLAWNRDHSFATLSHTAANVDLAQASTQFSLLSSAQELGTFWLSQFGVFGPIPFFLLLLAFGWALTKPRQSPEFRLMVLGLIPLLIISVQAFSSRAHGNWAVIAFVPASLLLARFAARDWRQTLLLVSLGLHTILATGLLVVLAKPDRFTEGPLGAVLQPLTGWDQTISEIMAKYANDGTGQPFAAIVTDTRLFHYSITWGLRHQSEIELKMWPRYGVPHSHRELMEPLLPGDPRKLLVIVSRPRFAPRVLADFRRIQSLGLVHIPLGAGRTRQFELFEAQGYAPQTRDEAYEQRWQYLDSPPS